MEHHEVNCQILISQKEKNSTNDTFAQRHPALEWWHKFSPQEKLDLDVEYQKLYGKTNFLLLDEIVEIWKRKTQS